MKLQLKFLWVGIGSVGCLLVADGLRLTPRHAQTLGFVWGMVCLSGLQWIDGKLR